MNNPITGISYLFKGFGLIKQPGVRQFVIIPFLINTLIFVLLGLIFFDWFGTMIDEFMLGLPEWMQWLDWLIWPLIWAASLVVMFFTFTAVANFISAPFNGVLAEAVEEKVTGKKFEDNSPWHTIITGIVPAIKEELRKLSYFLTRSIPFLICFMIPGVNMVASIVWMVFSAWMLVLQYADYPMSNHNISFKDQRGLLKEKRLLVLGFGAAVMVCMMIPVVNFIILPCAVAGATLMYVEQFKSESSPEH